MTLCDECINKENCDVQEIFKEGKLLLSHCKNFISKAPREIKTNFQRITASPEALAEFICDISFYFPWDDSEFCCRYNIETEQDRLNFIREWLKKESKE